MDQILTNVKPKADRKLLDDVLAAEAATHQELVECDDPYDGGCPADKARRNSFDGPVHPQFRVGHAAAAQQIREAMMARRRELEGRRQGTQPDSTTEQHLVAQLQELNELLHLALTSEKVDLAWERVRQMTGAA